MRFFNFFFPACIVLFLSFPAFTQDKVYFAAGGKAGIITALTQATLTYRPLQKNALPVIVGTKKVIIVFNKNGDFLIPSKMNFSSAQAREAINRFLHAAATPRQKDQLYTIASGRIDDNILSEDKKYIYLSGSTGKIEKKIIAAVVYKDGNHLLYAPATKAAAVLWTSIPPAGNADNPPPTVVQKDVQKETGIVSATPPVQTPQKAMADTPHALTFEDVAGNLSKDEFEKKAIQKTNQLNIYLKVICNKSADYNEINKAIDQSVGLFVNENALIETSSVNRNDVKRYKIRSYLSHIKLVNYDKIEIEWTNVQYVSDVKQGPDGNYYGVVSFEQVFRGYRDGRLIYQDVTRKNATVVLKTYEKNIEGNVKNIWDVLLSDIGVIYTKPL